MKKIFILIFFVFCSIFIYAEGWDFFKSLDYGRITDCIIEDIDNDGTDEVVISYFNFSVKKVDVYKIIDKKLSKIDEIEVPYYTVFFDVGDLDNDGNYDIVFLTSNGLYYRKILNRSDFSPVELKIIPSVTSEIVVPQPELLMDVNMIIDLDGDGLNELIIENIRAIEIFETKKFSKIFSINLKTILEYALIPGQFYPHYIFYTLPIILVMDLDNDGKMEIVTKFPRTINVFAQESRLNWVMKNRIYFGSDNVYFLSNSYVKFAFPVIEDIDSDDIKEIVVSSANLNLPRLKFEAIGDVYYFNKKSFKINKNKRIVVKGIPLNLPKFFNISNDKYKDLIIPVVPFNLISVFGLLSGGGSIKVPFVHFTQDQKEFDLKHSKKMFDIQVRIENITSFVEELPFDQYEPGIFPDFYYFSHNQKEKSVDIKEYSYLENKKEYRSNVIKNLVLPNYKPELPATLKLGNFFPDKKKEVLFISHTNFFLLFRK